LSSHIQSATGRRHAPGAGRVRLVTLGLGIGLLVYGASFALGSGLLKGTEPYDLTHRLIVDSPVIQTVVGDRPRLGPLATGSIDTDSAGGGSASVNVSVSGSGGSTRVATRWRRREGQWELSAAHYKDRGGKWHAFGTAHAGDR
jgi:hypothetical protein